MLGKPNFRAFAIRCWADGRCLMMGLAVLATFLATLSTWLLAFGLHLHVEPSHGSDVITKFDVGAQVGLGCGHVGHAPHAPLAEGDPNGCGHCHCSAPVSNLPHAAAAIFAAPVVLRLSFFALEQNHSGISYQPDPPPAKV